MDKLNKILSKHNKNFMALQRKEASKQLSNYFEVNNGKIIVDSKEEFQEVFDKILELDDWSVEIVLNFEDASKLFFVHLPEVDEELVHIKRRYVETSNLSKLKLDTSKVTNMSNMFDGCESLQSIPELDTSNVTDMGGMFRRCKSLESVPQLDTSKVTDIGGMFVGCESLQSIPQLDTSNVTDIGGMFNGCKSLKSIPQLDTSKVTNMSSMFDGCRSLQSIPELDTSNVTDMGEMFVRCESLKTIPQLDTSNVTYMGYMFIGCESLKSIPQLDTSKVVSMRNMFNGCKSLESVPQLDTSKVTYNSNMFDGCIYLKKLGYSINDSDKMLRCISSTGINQDSISKDESNKSLPELSSDEQVILSNHMKAINTALNKDIELVRTTFRNYLNNEGDDFIKLLPYINERLKDREDYDDIKDQLTKILQEVEKEVKMNKNFSRIDKVLSKYNKNFSQNKVRYQGTGLTREVNNFIDKLSISGRFVPQLKKIVDRAEGFKSNKPSADLTIDYLTFIMTLSKGEIKAIMKYYNEDDEEVQERLQKDHDEAIWKYSGDYDIEGYTYEYFIDLVQVFTI